MDQTDKVLTEMPVAALKELQKVLENIHKKYDDGDDVPAGHHVIRYTDTTGVKREFRISILSGKDFKRGLDGP